MVPELWLGSKFKQHVDTSHAATAAGIKQRSDPINSGCVDLKQQDTLRIIQYRRNALAVCVICSTKMHQNKMLAMFNLRIDFVCNFQSHSLWDSTYNILL